jgi:hypothetical protein
MTQPHKQKEQSPAERDKFQAEREERGAADQAQPADQLGATEQQVTPLTPPVREKPTDRPRPGEAHPKQRAADEIDPADEITPG